jgi:hypothetical protein
VSNLDHGAAGRLNAFLSKRRASTTLKSMWIFRRSKRCAKHLRDGCKS